VSVTIDDLRKVLGKYSKNKAALEKATPETALRRDLGIMSANLVDVVIELEDAYGITIADEEIARLTTLGEASALIEAKTKQKAG
jgi:acyl carrier protein